MSEPVVPEGTVRLIACDIDGTLLPFGNEKVSEENMRAIKEARDAGILVTLATGRHYPTARARVEEMGVADLPVIASNGADVRVNGRSVHISAMDDAIVEGIVKALIERGVPRYLFCEDEILCLPEDQDDEVFRMWTSDAGGTCPVRMYDSADELLEAARGRTQKMLAFVKTQEEHDSLLSFMNEMYGKTADITCGGGLNLEINAPGVTKALGLEKVCELLGIPIEQVMAIGDSGNDAEMLRAAGLGVAVGDAMEEARDAADVVVAAAEDDGVAEAIRVYALPGGEKRP